ncbi:MBG domain-containing protein [Chondrinema litorale]|uniref:MBG domain-containing protein n=1 Tax=Chondrinema litorale TaxID=2994555 RepID=UPI002542EEF7|nr:MBG domain-containing protein [Chondrinema litorale]UZR97363.1 MBG domain-containing protein [Chondrinema litorale]
MKRFALLLVLLGYAAIVFSQDKLSDVKLLKDINTGAGDSEADQFVVMDGILYFAANDGTHGRELWRSDGTEAGTYMVKDINPGSGSSFLSELTEIDGTLFFAAYNKTYGGEVWKSDGTTSGTQIVKDINPGSSSINPVNFTEYKGKLVFNTYVNPEKQSIWITDGTAGNTTMLAEYEIIEELTIRGIASTTNYLYFIVNGDIWRTDGPRNYLKKVVDRNPKDRYYYLTDFEFEQTINDRYYYSYRELNSYKDYFINYISDSDIEEEVYFYSGNDWQTFDLNNELHIFCRFNDGFFYFPIEFKKILDRINKIIIKNDGTLPSYSHSKNDIFNFNDSTILIGGNEIKISETYESIGVYPYESSGGTGLWKYNYNTGSISKIKTILSTEERLNYPNLYAPSYLGKYNNKIFFSAGQQEIGNELWVTDGTEEGTQLFADIIPGETGSNPEHLISNGEVLFFIADDGEHGRELWKYAPNQKPTSAAFNISIPEDNTYTFNSSSFPFYDENQDDELEQIQVTSLPAKGDLFLDNNSNNSEDSGEAISINQEISSSNISKLKFKPVSNENKEEYASLHFKVSDGFSYSDAAYKITITVTPLNDAPIFTLSNSTIEENEDASLVTVNGFLQNIASGPSSATDESAQQLSYQLSKIATSGSLSFSQAPQIDLFNGNLSFQSATNTYGEATFEIQLIDNGLSEGENENTSDKAVFKIKILPIIDGAPSVTNANTSINQQTRSGLVIKPNEVDGEEVTFFKITEIQKGKLFLNNGTTEILNSSFVAASEVVKGLKFTPDKDSKETGSFLVQASLSNDNEGLGGTTAKAEITVVENLVTFSFEDTEQTYDGSAKQVSVTSDPEGVDYSITYNGSTSYPKNAGSYEVKVNSTSNLYTGSATATLLIDKATAKITISDLAHTTDGSPKSVNVSTEPVGLNYLITYNGSEIQPSAVGSYQVFVSIDETNYEGEASATLLISEKAVVTINITETEHTYDGSTKEVNVSTNPVGLTYQVLYNNSESLPTNAGTYQVQVSVEYEGETFTKSATLKIKPMVVSFAVSDLSHVYDGNSKAVNITTDPLGVDVITTYNGNMSKPVDAGTYDVVVETNDDNYTGQFNGELEIQKAGATVTLSNLEQVYTGKPTYVSVNTNPVGLLVEILYNGQQESPSALGNYLVEADVIDKNYQGSATDTLKILEITGIEDKELNSQLTVYPNPTSGNFMIEDSSDEAEKASVLVFDINGKFISSHLKAKQTKNIAIDISNQASGVYIIYYQKANKTGILTVLKAG